MYKYTIGFLLLFISCASGADDWQLLSSNEAFWIKTTNSDQHELLFAYHEEKPQFLLILTTDSEPPDKPMPVIIRIDSGEKQPAYLTLLEERPEQSIFRIGIDKNLKADYVARMVAGLAWSIDMDSETEKNKHIIFSLKGFTVALNDLLIGNKIGSFDPDWLMAHKKDRELYCLLTTDISIKAMQHRLQGESYKGTLHLIQQTSYSIIDNNLAEIISQVYEIPLKDLSVVPRAEKYLMFSRCMAQPWQSRDN